MIFHLKEQSTQPTFCGDDHQWVLTSFVKKHNRFRFCSICLSQYLLTKKQSNNETNKMGN
jgi:hypothetical protein